MSKHGVTQTDFGWSNIVHTLQCPACNFQTLRPEVLQEHCKRSHRDLRRLIVFSCPLCHSRSTDVRLIDEHKRLYHTSDSVQAFASTSRSQARPGQPVSRDIEASRKRAASASTSSSHATSESPEECSVVRRTVRKSSIRAIAAMAPKDSESSAAEDHSPSLPKARRRSSGDSAGRPSGESSPPGPSGSGSAARPRREGRLDPAVRAHISILFSRGVRRPEEMAAQLQRFVKAELDGDAEDRMPSMWSLRRLLKTLATTAKSEEVVPSAHSKRARINLTSSPPAERALSSPVKSGSSSGETRPRKIFTSSSGPEFPIVKLEDNNVELVRCLKCGVRVPFQSDGTRAAQDLALMAHLANSHGIRKREPIVYPVARQRSASAQDHVTDLDAEAEEGKPEVRILKESGVLPAGATSSPVQVKLERDEELRMTGARIQPSTSRPQLLKRPPADDQEDVALVAVRLKEAAVKEQPSERQQIDLDTSTGSTLDPPKVMETFELTADFSDLDEKQEARSEQEKEEEEAEEENSCEQKEEEETKKQKKEERDETSQDELTMEVDADNGGKVNDDDGLQSTDSKLEEKQSRATSGKVEVDANGLARVNKAAECEEANLDIENNKSADEKDDFDEESDHAQTEDKEIGSVENGLDDKNIEIDQETNGLDDKNLDIDQEENGVDDKNLDIDQEENGLDDKNLDIDQETNEHTMKCEQQKVSNEPCPAEKELEGESIRVVRSSKQKLTGPEEWQCRHCFAGFENEGELQSHVADIHSQ